MKQKTIQSMVDVLLTEARLLTPKEHHKALIGDALPIITKASVEVSDYLEASNQDDLNRAWLRETGDVQLALMSLATFIKKNIK